MTESNLEGKDLFQLTAPSHSPSLKEVRQELEAEAVEECSLWACSWDLLSLLCYNI